MCESFSMRVLFTCDQTISFYVLFIAYRSIFPSAKTFGVGMRSCWRGLSFNPAKKQDWEWVLGTIGDALIGSTGRPHIFTANGWLEHEYFSCCAALVIFFPCNCQNTIIDLLHLDIHVSKRLSKHRSCIDLLHCIHVYYY